MKARFLAAVAALAFAATPVLAAGDLSIRPTELEDLVVASGEFGFGVSPKRHEMETGKAYSLKIKSEGKQECAFIAPDFAGAIWLRKVEVGDIEVKAPRFDEIEFNDGAELEAELFFVPVRTGTFKWSCRNMDARGMTGEFVVK